MGTRRFVYNKVLNKIKEGKETINFQQLRNKYVTNTIVNTENQIIPNPNVEEWQISIPKDIRAFAIKELITNYKICFSQLQKGLIPNFNMRYLSKKRDIPSIRIPKSAIHLKNGKILIYKTYSKKPICKTNRDILRRINHDCRLQLKNNKWYLCVPYLKKKKEEQSINNYCALDPGIRTFQTVYSDQKILQVKINTELIERLETKIDTMRSLRSKHIIGRSHFKRRHQKIQSRMTNLTDELHYKTIDLLTTNYKTISIPNFESQKISEKMSIKKVNRRLFQLRHFTFRERLKMKCDERKCHLDICTEEYTSQCCSRCGLLNKVGSNDIFHCGGCQLILDRDVNGARNIMIKRMNRL